MKKNVDLKLIDTRIAMSTEKLSDVVHDADNAENLLQSCKLKAIYTFLIVQVKLRRSTVTARDIKTTDRVTVTSRTGMTVAVRRV